MIEKDFVPWKPDEIVDIQLVPNLVTNGLLGFSYTWEK